MLLVRVTVVAALLLLFGAAAAMVVAAASRNHPLAAADARFIHARLVDDDQGVRAQLVRIRPAASLMPARRHTRAAIARIDALGRAVRGSGGTTALRLRVAIDSELRFLDAVGSVLTNPRSARLAELAALDLAARQAIAALDGPRARRKGGVRALQRLRGGGVPVPAEPAVAA
jgi:hypothetical protein